MNITILGAGAIGSLLGAHLTRHHTVTLIGRPPHITAIQQQGLAVTGKTRFHGAITTAPTLTATLPAPDLIILTVKAYDTKAAATQIKTILQPTTLVLTLQNGLGNIETLQETLPKDQILAGVITHGALLKEPGTIQHTGTGDIIIGELDGTITDRVQTIANAFTLSGLPTTTSNHIISDIWTKTIVNSSINPITAFFSCQNGYLDTNPVLTGAVDMVCEESTRIAQADGINLTIGDMKRLTHQVIKATAHNSSSMLQSIQHGKPTEINALNQALVRIAGKNHLDAPLNQLLTALIHWKEERNKNLHPMLP